MKPNIDTSLVQRVHFFSVLDQPQLAQIIASTVAIPLQENERLFEHGQPAKRFYLLIEGQIKLFRVSEGGNEKIIEILGPSKLFAEAVMFMSQQRYPVASVALQESLVYSFDNHVFLNLLRDSNELCMALLGDLSMRLHTRLNEIDNLALQNATYRSVDYLFELLVDPQAATGTVELAAPKLAIASKLSITPETFSRILHTMEREGIVTIDGRKVDIHSTQRLRQFGRFDRALYASQKP